MEKMVFTPFIQVQQEIVRLDASQYRGALTAKQAENTATPSFVKDVLSTPDVIPGLEPEEFEEAVKWTAGSMYGGKPSPVLLFNHLDAGSIQLGGKQ